MLTKVNHLRKPLSNGRPPPASIDGIHAAPLETGHAAAAVGAQRATLTVQRALGRPAGTRRSARPARPARAGRRRRHRARPLRGADRRHAARTPTAIAVDGAAAPGFDAASAAVGRSETPEAAARVGNARQSVAAVRRRRAGVSGVTALGAEPVTSRDAERVQLADPGVAHAAAAVVSRGRVTARVVFEMAHVAFGVAAHRIAADPDGSTGGLVADDVAVAGQSRAGCPTTIAGLTAEIAVDVTATRGLTHQDSRRTVRRTQTAAALVAGAASRSIDASATE